MPRNRFVVMARIARPASPEDERDVARVERAMRCITGNIVERAGRHGFNSGHAIFAHKNKHARALSRGVILTAVAFGMEMSAGHKILTANAAWFDGRRAPR